MNDFSNFSAHHLTHFVDANKMVRTEIPHPRSSPTALITNPFSCRQENGLYQ